MWDVHVARVAKLRFAEGMTANLLQTVVRPLERLAVTGSFALGVYLALSTNDPVYIGALFAFLLLTQRVAGPLMQMAQLVQQYDEARIAVDFVGALVNQPAEEGRSGSGVRTPLQGHVEFSNVIVQIQGRDLAGLGKALVRSAGGYDLRHYGPERIGQDDDHAAVAAPALQL